MCFSKQTNQQKKPRSICYKKIIKKLNKKKTKQNKTKIVVWF